jgi:hypothetical protein
MPIILALGRLRQRVMSLRPATQEVEVGKSVASPGKSEIPYF